MTSQEQEMIQGLIDRVRQTQLPEKDSEAENLLQGSLGRNPDALYILAQTVLVQKYALEQAQKQIADLKSQVDQSRQQAPQPEHHTSFLGSLLGRNDPPPPPPPPQANAQPPYAPVPGYAPQQPSYGAPPPQYGNPAFGAPPSSGSGGFLRSAMQTATGVAAGALAFQGIESLMHGFGGGGGFGSAQGLGGFGGGAPREEIVNNYYGDSDRDRDSGGLSPDIEDRRGDRDSSDRFADSAGDTASDYGTDSDSDSSLDAGADTSSFDSGADDSSFDSGSDDSSFDSGGDDSSFS